MNTKLSAKGNLSRAIELERLEGGCYDDARIRLVNDVSGDWDTCAVGDIGRSWCCRFAPKPGAIRVCSTVPCTSISIN